MTYPLAYRLSPYLSLRWHHGGGHVPALLQWRWRGWLVAVVEAGQA